MAQHDRRAAHPLSGALAAGVGEGPERRVLRQPVAYPPSACRSLAVRFCRPKPVRTLDGEPIPFAKMTLTWAVPPAGTGEASYDLRRAQGDAQRA